MINLFTPQPGTTKKTGIITDKLSNNRYSVEDQSGRVFIVDGDIGYQINQTVVFIDLQIISETGSNPTATTYQV